MSRQPNLIRVAVGIIIDADKKILIAKRPAHKYCPGLWEFPGGKIEANEDALSALKRELFEELNIQVTAANEWFQVKHTYPDRLVLLENFLVTQYENQPEGAEGQEIRWVSFAELGDYTFPEGNKAIIEKLVGY